LNGPLLISLLPPDGGPGSPAAASGAAPFIAILLLAGFLLSLFLRRPRRIR
jgi:hypothetical protein